MKRICPDTFSEGYNSTSLMRFAIGVISSLRVTPRGTVSIMRPKSELQVASNASRFASLTPNISINLY